MRYYITKEHLSGVLAGMVTTECQLRESPLEVGRIYGSLTSGRYLVVSVEVAPWQ